MSSVSRKDRIKEARSEMAAVNAQLNRLSEEVQSLELEQKKEDHPCDCVKLNRDVEIYDMNEQTRRKRNPLDMGGFVAETLSARMDCDVCLGTGIPRKHNHFGEVFCPDSCSACAYQQTHKVQ